ncbi:acyl carrier protein [Streptomyces sp. NPDC093586]|uniref:acyl carrier protein n=1 Tax=Streptomyces sp. NPDC093586 TaxID=3366042 RepID=UPI0038189118
MTTKIDQLHAWITAQHAELPAFDHDTDLIESGLVTSLQFVQMVMEIERIHGDKLEPGVITIDKMRSLRAIDKAVFQTQSETV